MQDSKFNFVKLLSLTEFPIHEKPVKISILRDYRPSNSIDCRNASAAAITRIYGTSKTGGKRFADRFRGAQLLMDQIRFSVSLRPWKRSGEKVGESY